MSEGEATEDILWKFSHDCGNLKDMTRLEFEISYIELEYGTIEYKCWMFGGYGPGNDEKYEVDFCPGCGKKLEIPR